MTPAEKHAARSRLYQKAYPDREKARNLVQVAVYNNLLLKPKCCQKCRQNKHKMHAHHFDYNRPYNVWWLCPKCHGYVHAHNTAPPDNIANQVTYTKKGLQIMKDMRAHKARQRFYKLDIPKAAIRALSS